MTNQDIEIKIIHLGSLLNIMDREFDEFSETADRGTIPHRIDDFRTLVESIQGIVRDILEPAEVNAS